MSGFVKQYTHRAVAEEAWRRSVALRGAGVSTPAVLGISGEKSLCFERIDGQTGRLLVADDLVPLLSVVAPLHRAGVENLPRYDPFLRVLPRLTLPTQLPVGDILSEPVPVGHATIHGDLHVGQFIRSDDRQVWVVDFDDLAIGPPEADLANFVAHLATSLPSLGIGDWLERLCEAWSQIGETADRGVLARFLRFALLRRHLKLREAGRPDFEIEILTYLRESSNFSIR